MSLLLTAPSGHDLPLKIGFLTTLHVNVGDEFIRQGIRHCVDRVRVPWIPFFVNKHDPKSLVEVRDGEVDQVANKIRDVDIFIQSGSPVYWHHGQGGHRSTHAEWHDWVWENGLLNSVERPTLLNLGAGSCQPWADTGDSFVNDPECADFARRAAARSSLTTVRDPVASNMLTRLGVSHHSLPCPAFLAAASFATHSSAGTLIGVNLMPKGGHFEFQTRRSTPAWVRQLHDLLQRLRSQGRVLFICHSVEEQHFAHLFAEGTEQVFYSPNYRDYFDVFRMLTCIFSNRVHAAVTAAGFGVPGVIAGTDTRVQIGEWLGLGALHSPDLHAEEAAALVEALLGQRQQHRERLLCLRNETEARYLELLAPILESVSPRYLPPRPAAVRHPFVKWAASVPGADPWTARLGLEPQWPIEERGFYESETWHGEPLRWTNGQAILQIPDELTLLCAGVEISFWNLFPPGFHFLVRINGSFLAQQDKVGREIAGVESHDVSRYWTGSAVFPPQPLRTIEIISDTRPGTDDPRTLGMAIRQIRPLHCVLAESKVESTAAR